MDGTDRRLGVTAELLSEVIESTPDFIGIATADGKVVYFNDAFSRLLPARSAGRPLASFRITDFHPPKVGQMLLQEAIPDAVKHGQWQGRTELLDAHGNAFPVTHIIIAHMDAGGTLLRLSSIMRDLRPLLQPKAETTDGLLPVDSLTKEVERLNQAMIEREFRIAQLKQENEELKQRLATREV